MHIGVVIMYEYVWFGHSSIPHLLVYHLLSVHLSLFLCV